MGFLRVFFGSRPAHTQTGRDRIEADWPDVIYAIGDVHGRLDLLRKLEHAIIEDAQSFRGEKWIVMLGDYVDRGFDSAGVVRHLLDKAPHGFRRICLYGNHEAMMLEGLTDRRTFENWQRFGGIDTLQSYGLSSHLSVKGPTHWHKITRAMAACIPAEHIAFLSRLPVSLTVGNYIFVHAGLQPGRALADHTDTQLLWTRSRPEQASDMTIVHGHTIVEEPLAGPGEINVDTGAFHSGVLTCVRLEQKAEPRFIQARANTADLLHAPGSADRHE